MVSDLHNSWRDGYCGPKQAVCKSLDCRRPKALGSHHRGGTWATAADVIFLGVCCRWVIVRWLSSRPPALQVSLQALFPAPLLKLFKEIHMNQPLSSNSQWPNGAQCPNPTNMHYCRSVNAQPFCHSTVLLESPAAWLDRRHCFLYPTHSPIASFSKISSNQPTANPIHA